MWRVQPFRRRLFTLAAAISLLLCFATTGLWVRSYFSRDVWIAYTKAGFIYLSANRGLFIAEWDRGDVRLVFGWSHASHATHHLNTSRFRFAREPNVHNPFAPTILSLRG